MISLSNVFNLENPKIGPSKLTKREDNMRKAYPVTALGGTFDYLHPGHKILLSMAAWITTSKLIVGVTG
jgi:pantetheine-phosphate adenylyltransferase